MDLLQSVLKIYLDILKCSFDKTQRYFIIIVYLFMKIVYKILI